MLCRRAFDTFAEGTYDFEAPVAIVFALSQMELFVDYILRCVVNDKKNWDRYDQINANDYVC